MTNTAAHQRYAPLRPAGAYSPDRSGMANRPALAFLAFITPCTVFMEFNLVGRIFAPELILIGLLWAFLHHFCMGIRILLLDMNMGTDLKPARTSAKVVMVVSLALTVILGAKLW